LPAFLGDPPGIVRALAGVRQLACGLVLRAFRRLGRGERRA